MRKQLGAAVAATKLKVFNKTIRPEQVPQWVIDNGPRSIWKIGVEEVPQRELAALSDELSGPLCAFTNPDTGQIGFALRDCMCGFTNRLTKNIFAIDLILTAAVLGSDRTLSTFTGWINGEPAKYSRVFLLRGISVPEPVSLGKGVRFEKLSSRSEYLAEYIGKFSIPAGNLVCQPVMLMDITIDPIFYMPEGDEKNESGRLRMRQRSIAYPEIVTGQRFIIDVLNALSLACGSCVQVVNQWDDYSDAMLLMRGGGFGPQLGIYNVPKFESGRILVGESKVTPESLKNAKAILDQMPGRCDLNVAITRWMNSVTALDEANRIIDLRTVLESLYCCGGRNEVKLRTTLRGALHLAPTLADRKKYYTKLSDLYDLASNVVHGGSLSNMDGVNDLLTWSFAVLRQAIIKRLQEDREMDWDALMLGLPNS